MEVNPVSLEVVAQIGCTMGQVCIMFNKTGLHLCLLWRLLRLIQFSKVLQLVHERVSGQKAKFPLPHIICPITLLWHLRLYSLLFFLS